MNVDDDVVEVQAAAALSVPLGQSHRRRIRSIIGGTDLRAEAVPVAEEEAAAAPAEHAVTLADVPAYLREQLKPHQTEGVSFLLRRCQSTTVSAVLLHASACCCCCRCR